jgi:heme A synthase
MIEIYLTCSVAPIPMATLTNREWGQMGNNYLRALFALAFQGFFLMVCVGIYAVLVNDMVIAASIHTAIFSVAAYTVILCIAMMKSGSLSKSIFNAH